MTKENEEACLANYKNKINALNSEAYELYEKLNFAQNNISEFSILNDNYSFNDNKIKRDNNDESVFDEKKEFLINEIDVLQNKEKILLDEVN